MSKATFFTIEHKSHSPSMHGSQWADTYWDAFGFDYDKERCDEHHVFAWPIEDGPEGIEALKTALEDEEVHYTMFEAEVDSVFPTEEEST